MYEHVPVKIERKKRKLLSRAFKMTKIDLKLSETISLNHLLKDELHPDLTIIHLCKCLLICEKHHKYYLKSKEIYVNYLYQ